MPFFPYETALPEVFPHTALRVFIARNQPSAETGDAARGWGRHPGEPSRTEDSLLRIAVRGPNVINLPRVTDSALTRSTQRDAGATAIHFQVTLMLSGNLAKAKATTTQHILFPNKFQMNFSCKYLIETVTQPMGQTASVFVVNVHQNRLSSLAIQPGGYARQYSRRFPLAMYHHLTTFAPWVLSQERWQHLCIHLVTTRPSKETLERWHLDSGKVRN